jgi:hypothetical protein
MTGIHDILLSHGFFNPRESAIASHGSEAVQAIPEGQTFNWGLNWENPRAKWKTLWLKIYKIITRFEEKMKCFQLIYPNN